MIALEQLRLLAGTKPLGPLNWTIPAGAHAVLMGRSGQGKTTLLEAICGLRPIQSGVIRLQSQDVTRWSPAARGIGYVPQDLTLFPTMSVRQHLEFALRVRRTLTAESQTWIDELAQWLGIKDLGDRLPSALSGGERQRVALGRALAFQPSVLLLDEPFSALDEDLRQELFELLRTVRERTQVTILHVTHLRTEATAWATEMRRLEAGELLES